MGKVNWILLLYIFIQSGTILTLTNLNKPRRHITILQSLDGREASKVIKSAIKNPIEELKWNTDNI